MTWFFKGLTYPKVCSQVNGGFLEGIVRGYKAGILTPSQYASLGQCETLEGELAMEYIIIGPLILADVNHRLSNAAVDE